MWAWLRRKSNREILALAGPVIAAIAVAAWTVFTYFDDRSDGAGKGPSVQVDHGVAVGGNIEGSTITIEGASEGGAKAE